MKSPVALLQRGFFIQKFSLFVDGIDHVEELD